jgi:hypothetical protein
MNARRRLPGLLMVCALMAVLRLVGIATASTYVYSAVPYDYNTPAVLIYNETQWIEEIAAVSGEDVPEYDFAYVTCTADGYVRGTDDTADAGPWADGGIYRTWEWDGPPGTAPGGTLSWYHTGDGSAQAYGKTYNLVAGDTAQSDAYAFAGSLVRPEATGGETAAAIGTASASVLNSNTGTGDYDIDGYPDPGSVYYSYPTEEIGQGFAYFSVEWNAFYEPDDPEDIPSGTSYVDLLGAVLCWCDLDATSSTSQGGYAEAEGTANATVYAYGDFEPN